MSDTRTQIMIGAFLTTTVMLLCILQGCSCLAETAVVLDPSTEWILSSASQQITSLLAFVPLLSAAILFCVFINKPFETTVSMDPTEVKRFTNSPAAIPSPRSVSRAQDYISSAAHDLKTPLQTFYLSLDLLKQTGLTNAQLELIEQASVAADLMKLTTNQAVDAQRLSGGFQLQPHIAMCSIRATTDRVLKIM